MSERREFDVVVYGGTSAGVTVSGAQLPAISGICRLTLRCLKRHMRGFGSAAKREV